MRKKLLLLLTLTVCFVLSLAAFAACGESGTTGGNQTGGGTSQGGGNMPGGDPDDPNTPALLDFTGVTFTDVTIDYDGNAHKLEVKGAPEDATVTYGGDYQAKTLPGTYTATAKVEKEGYNTLNLSATLKINALNFTGVTFGNVTVDYDGNAHSLTVSGAPEGTNITYGGDYQAKTLPGTYTATAKVEKEGYNTLNLSATLKINALNFTGVTFGNVTVDYDGNPHSLTVSGAPEGTNITYGGDYQAKTLPGTYTATATVEKEGYNALNLSATLKINALNFTGVTFGNVTVDYDGNPHSLEVKGAPEGTNITYSTAQNHIDAGSYSVTATIEKTGYNKKSLAATLTINKIYFPESGLTLDDVSVDYDEQDHAGDVRLVGAIPADTNVSYTITKNGTTVTSAIEAGDYTVTVKLTNKNYFDKSLAATLTIKTVKKDMAVYAMPDGTVYFSNGLDNDYLYSITKDGTITKIKSDVVKSFVKSSATTLDYISTAAYINSIKTLTQGTAATETSEATKDEVKALFSFGKFDYIARNGNTLYYSANFVTAAQSGIYSVDLSAEEPEEVKIFEGKTKNLAYYNGFLYFANGNDGNTLYKLNVSTKAATKVADVKIHEFVFDGTRLYMTVNGTLNDYIGSIDLSSASGTVKKLSDRAGEYLTVYNDYVYYNNSDLFTNFKPAERGVWKVSVNGTNEAQVLKLANGINALTYDYKNDRFVYIDATDLHLYAYDVSNNKTTDLLEGFTPPEYKRPNTGGESVIKGNKLYYLNMFADKTLYSYDTVSGFKQQLTTEKVEDFYIDGDYLYFNQVTNLTNNDLYRINLTLGGAAEKVSSNDCRDMVPYGEYIYYVHHNWAGGAGGLGRIKKDGSGTAVKFSEANGASNLRVVGDKLYYLDGGKIYYFDLTTVTDESADLTGTLLNKDVKNVDQFEIEGDNLYYIYTGTTTKEIRRAALSDPTNYTALASKNAAPTEFVIDGDYIYYYSYPASSIMSKNYPALWRVNKNATETDTEKEEILKTETPNVKVNGVQNTDKNFYCAAISVKDGKVYFLNSLYFLGTSGSNDKCDDHTYCYDIANKTLTKLD